MCIRYSEWCAIARGSQYNVNERRGSIYAHCTTGHSLCFLCSNKWPTRGFWNEISLLCTFPVFPPHKERVLEVPLPFIHNECICPTSAMIRFLHMSRDVPNNMPLLSILQSGKIIPLTQDMVRKKLSQLLPDKIYGTHSLRRGGATWLLVSGVSLDMVKSLGDWKSDAVLKYIKTSNAAKFDSIQLALSKLS